MQQIDKGDKVHMWHHVNFDKGKIITLLAKIEQMHIYRCISELGRIQAQDIHVNTCTTYDHRDIH